MTREDLQRNIDECIEACDSIDSFYMTIKNKSGNITSNIWGKWYEFEEKSKEIESEFDELLIEKIIFYSRTHENMWVKNQLYDDLEMDSCDSHIHVNIPYINTDGKFYDLEKK